MTDETRRPVTYKDAGVDTAEGARAVERIRDAVRSTYRPEVIGDIGGFGGLFSAAAFKDMDDPVLVSRHRRRGHQAQARAAARPARHRGHRPRGDVRERHPRLRRRAAVLPRLRRRRQARQRAHGARSSAGIAEGCRQAGCALVGGEMAEHPGAMDADDYDLSGFCVGVVDRPKMIDGERRRSRATSSSASPRAACTPTASRSCAARVVEGHEAELDAAARRPRRRDARRGAAHADAHLREVGARAAASAARPCKAMAHITGGGITENLDRVLPEGLRRAWCTAARGRCRRVIETVVEAAALDDDEAYRTFNMGIGFALVLDPADAPDGRGDAAGGRRAACSRSARSSQGTGKVVYR